MGALSARGRVVGRRALDRRHLPAGPHRETDRPPDRSSLKREPSGRLAPEEMWPAGVSSLRSRHVTTASGHSVRVVESGPVDGPPILLVHGWGSSVYSFSDTIPALANGGNRVLALDLPGFGLSDKPADADCYTTQGV